MQRNAKIRRTIPVFYVADDARMPYLSVSLISLLQNASAAYRYEAHILHTGLSEEYAAPVRALATPHCSVTFTDVSARIAALENRLQTNGCRAGELSYCMLLADLFPQYGKAVVLSAQTVADGDVSALYRTEMQNAPVAAVTDTRKEITAGVLVLNLRVLREENLYAQYVRLLSARRFSEAQEKDCFNALFHGRVIPLSADWNASIEDEECEPQIVRYDADRVPWRYDDVPYGGHFWRYAHLSPFLGEILGERIRFARERGAADTWYATDRRGRAAAPDAPQPIAMRKSAFAPAR